MEKLWDLIAAQKDVIAATDFQTSFKTFFRRVEKCVPELLVDYGVIHENGEVVSKEAKAVPAKYQNSVAYEMSYTKVRPT
jgi:hypothetical protein